MSAVDDALKWAKIGVPVFPCGDNKAPLTTNGHLDASTDPEKIKAMFEFSPNAMIGARMGEESKLFAVDFDLYKPGAEEYMQQLSDKGLLNDTQIHTTQSGGIHLLYRSDSEYPNCKPHIGVEVKGEGGYVIVPPSRGYSVQQEGIAYANPELIKEFLNAKRESSSSTVDQLKRLVLSGESFHDPLAQIAARRSAQGWPIERVQREIYDVLEASAAAKPDHPRHDRWRSVVNDESGELSRIVGSSNEKFNPHAGSEKVKDVRPSFMEQTASASEGIFNRKQEAPAEPVAIPYLGEWPFDDSGYFSRDERDIFSQKYVAYPLFAERESVLLAAEPKAGKTAIALKLAMQVANGENLGDEFQVTTARPVLYFTLEGARAVELRIRAEHLRRKEEGKPDPDRDMLYVVDRPHNFADAGQRAANCLKIAAHDNMCRSEFGQELGLVIIDTLTKAMPGGDQNAVESTSELFEMIGMLREAGVNATIVFIHHLAKHGGVRGSTNIEAEVDVVLGVRKDKKTGLVWMEIWRARSMDEDTAYPFFFESVHLGETSQGHQLHAPVVRLAQEEIDTAGASAAMAVQIGKRLEAIIELGKGVHDIREVVNALAPVANITMPSGRRGKYDTKAITRQIVEALMLDGKPVLYKDHIIKFNYEKEIIVTVEVLSPS